MLTKKLNFLYLNFDELLHNAINKYGARNLEPSKRKNKKYVVTLQDGQKIHFGDRRYSDYTLHEDEERRERYRKRAREIRNEKGEKTYLDRTSPNFWSYNLLW